MKQKAVDFDTEVRLYRIAIEDDIKKICSVCGTDKGYTYVSPSGKKDTQWRLSVDGHRLCVNCAAKKYLRKIK